MSFEPKDSNQDVFVTQATSSPKQVVEGTTRADMGVLPKSKGEQNKLVSSKNTSESKNAHPMKTGPKTTQERSKSSGKVQEGKDQAEKKTKAQRSVGQTRSNAAGVKEQSKRIKQPQMKHPQSKPMNHEPAQAQEHLNEKKVQDMMILDTYGSNDMHLAKMEVPQNEGGEGIFMPQQVLVLIDADNMSYQLAPSVMQVIEPYWSDIQGMLMASNSESSTSAERWRKAVHKKNKYMCQMGVYCKTNKQDQYVCSGAQGADSELLYAMHEFVRKYAKPKEHSHAEARAEHRVLIICISNDQDLRAYAQVLLRKYESVKVLAIGYAKDKMPREQEGLLVSTSEQGGSCMVKERTDIPLIVQYLNAKQVQITHDSLGVGSLQDKGASLMEAPANKTAAVDASVECEKQQTSVSRADALVGSVREDVEIRDARERAWKSLDINKMHSVFDVLNPVQNKMLLEILRSMGIHKKAVEIARLNLGPKLNMLKLSEGQKKVLYNWFGRPENPLILRLDEHKVFNI